MDSLILQEAPILFIAGLAVSLVATAITQSWIVATSIPLVPMILFFLYRAPGRTSPLGPEDIVSPVDGIIEEIKEHQDTVEIVFYVHELDPQIQWIPFEGKIKSIKEEGNAMKMNLMRYDSRHLENNQRVTTTINTARGPIIVEQIRSVASYQSDVFPEVSDSVTRSSHLGYMMFPARIDMIIPKSASLSIHAGERVQGGKTVIAQFKSV